MKKISMVVLAAVMMVFSAVFVFAAEEKVVAAPAEEEAKWAAFAEVSVAGHSGYINEATGGAAYRKALFTQSIMAGLDKGEKLGLYVQAENFSPSEKEGRETDFYFGFYAEKFGIKVDAGVAFYWVREYKVNDYYAVYAAIDFPAPVWGVVPFIKAEYDFSKKEEGEDMNGFMYFVGMKREFKLHERITVTPEIGVGGNTGLYGLPADNIAYAREKVDVSVSVVEHLKLKLTLQTQQNLGKQEGIAEDTDRLFVYLSAVATF